MTNWMSFKYFFWKFNTPCTCVLRPPPPHPMTIEWKTGRAKGNSHKHGGWFFAGEASASEFRSNEGWESLFHRVSKVNNEELNEKFRIKKESLEILIFVPLTPDTGKIFTWLIRLEYEYFIESQWRFLSLNSDKTRTTSWLHPLKRNPMQTGHSRVPGKKMRQCLQRDITRNWPKTICSVR